MSDLDFWSFVKTARAPIVGGVQGPTTAYGKWLADRGHLYPAHKKPGLEYVNIYGNPDNVDPDRPFGLIVYEPALAEHHYPELADAIYGLNRIQPEDWQIVHLISGDVLAEPRDWRKTRIW